MSEKYRFEPQPEVQGASVVPPSTLNVYASEVFPGSLSMTMTRGGFIAAGTRLTERQAGEIIEAFYDIFPGLSLARDQEFADTYEQGYKDGYEVSPYAVTEGAA